MDCNQDYYHSQYRLRPDYDENMDTMKDRNNYDQYICSVGGNVKLHKVSNPKQHLPKDMQHSVVNYLWGGHSKGGRGAEY